MKAQDLRERTTEDLRELELSLGGDRFQNRFKNFTNRLDDTSIIRKSKRDLARVKMILAERARGIAPSAPSADAPKPKPKAAKVAKPKASPAEAEPKAAAPKKSAKAAKPKTDKPKAESKGKAKKTVQKETE
jgi:large subunit ribosomal protein L29